MAPSPRTSSRQDATALPSMSSTFWAFMILASLLIAYCNGGAAGRPGPRGPLRGPVRIGSSAARALHRRRQARARVRGSAAWPPGPTETHTALPFPLQLAKTPSRVAGARHQHRSSGVPRAARRAASPAPPVGAATLSVAPGVPSQRGRLVGRLGPASSRLRRRRRDLPARRGGRYRPGRGDRPGGSRAVQVGLRRTRPGRAGPGGGDGAAAPRAVRSPGPEAGPARRWQRRRSGPLSPPPEQERAAAAAEPEKAAAAEQRRKATRISGAGRQAISAGAAPDPPSPPGRCAIRGRSGPCWRRGSGGGGGADSWGRGGQSPAPGPPAPRSARWWPSGRSGGRRGPRLSANLPAPARPLPGALPRAVPSPCPKDTDRLPEWRLQSRRSAALAADGGRDRAAVAAAPSGALMRRLDLRCATSGASAELALRDAAPEGTLGTRRGRALLLPGPGDSRAVPQRRGLTTDCGVYLVFPERDQACGLLIRPLPSSVPVTYLGQLAAGTCEIVTLDRDSSQPRRTIARQTARCACRKGQIAGTTRARPACVDARIIKTKQWCDMLPCLEGEGCDLLINRSGWTCTQPGGRIKTTTVS